MNWFHHLFSTINTRALDYFLLCTSCYLDQKSTGKNRKYQQDLDELNPVMRQMYEKIIKRRGRCWFNAIDIENIFDAMNGHKIWNTLNEMKNNTRSDITYTKELEMKKGVRQGSILSPILSIIMMNEIQKRWSSKSNMLY